MSLRRRHPLPLTIVIELTAVTTFSRLRVPVFNEFGSAHGRHIRTLRIEGSSRPPDDGFAPLVDAPGVNVIALPASGCEPGRIGAWSSSSTPAVGTLAVTIEGHTDSDGSDAHNLDLSQRRARSVVAWLTARGIDAARLTAEGRGETRPIADNATSAGRALNRRVEVGPRM